MLFNLPDVGEGLVEADITKWLVQAGDEVKINDPLVEVETAKIVVELPSPVAGRVVKLLAETGQTVEVGAPIIEIDDGAEPIGDEDDPSDAGSVTQEANLVGAGPIPEPSIRSQLVSPITTAAGKVLAKPLVRRLARDLGVSLPDIRPTGPGGTISKADVEAAAGLTATKGVPASQMRLATARNVAGSVTRHVHVTEFNTIDVTRTMELVQELKARKDFAGLHISPLLIVAKAVIIALQAHPMLNASWIDETIVEHEQINLGFAADTPRGLLVPVLHDASGHNLRGLAKEFGELIETARAGKLRASQLQGGTFTITNIGVFGVDSGTPIINGDESAILAVGAIKRQPWVVGSGADERLEIRSVMTLALSFDHQMIDGAEGSSFLRDISTILTDPAMSMLF